MARRKVVFAEGEYFHVYNRGCNREYIFRESDNYTYLLWLVKESVQKHRIQMISYCLMPNHYHFLVRQDSDRPVSDFVQEVFNRYVKAFNLRYCRSGTLFEERYKAKHVDRDEYLIHLCRYIHRNPLEVGLVKRIEDWEFSNYLEFIGKRHEDLTDTNLVRAWFPKPEDYVRFVLEYESPRSLAKNLKKYLLD